MKTLFTVTSIVLVTVHFFGQTVSYDNVKSPRHKTINTSYEVGNTNASINVSSSGALISRIPIYILPGTAGMQPSVSVNYNSQSGNGTMGMGWNVSAASSINRIPKTVYSHGKFEAIELSYNDTGYVSGLLTQSATTVPGFGVSLASWHATAYIYYQTFANGIFPEIFGNTFQWYSPFVGIGGVLSGSGFAVPFYTREYMKKNYTAIIYPY
jgi:hypothetical protein